MAVPALALLLAGCANGIGGGGGDVGPGGTGNADQQGLFGSSMQTTTVRPDGTSTAAGTPAAGTPATGTPAAGGTAAVAATTPGAGADSDFSCPRVEVRGGAAAWQVTEPTDGALRYQATLGQFARDCRFTTPDMNMRIGIQGRVLLGAKGGPGKVDVPIRLAVVEEGPVPKSIWTKFYAVPVEIGENVLQVDFSILADDVNFPRPDAATLDRYVVYVGFDPQGAKEAKPARPRQTTTRPKPARPKPATPKPAASAAPAPVQSAPARTAPAAPTPAVSAPSTTAPASTAPAATSPAPAQDSQNQWIGAPAPSTGGFSQ
ncbi:hypothetical protein NVS89_07825 [Ancylobacter sp. MQZ15Z-1]|uniref:Uncharacterized protein n=1 Tax=Ancylobacter mangrovi TaxID=2972472 RepID=A0A9X2PF35_9HYPH|nr:hypothetical protein [Ancylobacter mangrovi]MCS0495003.1 hypothetical protein [Ancylobacter mangrovi]